MIIVSLLAIAYIIAGIYWGKEMNKEIYQAVEMCKTYYGYLTFSERFVLFVRMYLVLATVLIWPVLVLAIRTLVKDNI